MRKKFAMRCRREVLRRGAIILNERPILSKQERNEGNIKKKYTGFEVNVKYRGSAYCIAGRDMLEAYRLLIWALDVEDEEV